MAAPDLHSNTIALRDYLRDADTGTDLWAAGASTIDAYLGRAAVTASSAAMPLIVVYPLGLVAEAEMGSFPLGAGGGHRGLEVRMAVDVMTSWRSEPDSAQQTCVEMANAVLTKLLEDVSWGAGIAGNAAVWVGEWIVEPADVFADMTTDAWPWLTWRWETPAVIYAQV